MVEPFGKYKNKTGSTAILKEEMIMPPIKFVKPNLWALSGNGISVRYSTIPLIGPAGGPHFIYQDSQRTLTFGAKDNLYGGLV